MRNIATVEKVNNLEKAKAYHEKKLMKKVFEAWLFLRVRISYTTDRSVYSVPAHCCDYTCICYSILPNTTTAECMNLILPALTEYFYSL